MESFAENRPRTANAAGSALALLSSFLFTSINFMIKYFGPNPTDIQIVRSVVTLVILGLVCALWGQRRKANLSEELDRGAVLAMAAQGIASAAQIYLTNLSVTFIPLGECLSG